MHPLNIPEIAELMRSLKNHDGEMYAGKEMKKVDGEEKEKIEDALFNLLMQDSIKSYVKVYNIDKYRKKKQNK